MEIGQSFRVTEAKDFNDRGILVARYLPELSYRVTELNQAFVEGLEQEGIAIAGAQSPAGTAAAGARTRASVTVGATKKGK
jgi:hypothetical protein